MAEETEADKDLKSVTAMAKRLQLTGREAAEYVHEHMSKLGYKSKRSYYSDDKGSRRSSGSGFFGGGSSRDDDDDL